MSDVLQMIKTQMTQAITDID